MEKPRSNESNKLHLRCYIKHEDKLSLAYWIRFKKNDVLCGYGNQYFSFLLQSSIEFHLRYPQDGTIHNSYKYYPLHIEDKELYITAYPEQTKYKSIIAGEKEEVLSTEKSLLNHLLPADKPAPLEEYRGSSQWFSFPLTGFRFPLTPESAYLKYAQPTTKIPKSTDIVIESTAELSGCLNISGFIAGEKYDPPCLECKSWITTRSVNGLRIGIVARLIP